MGTIVDVCCDKNQSQKRESEKIHRVIRNKQVKIIQSLERSQIKETKNKEETTKLQLQENEGQEQFFDIQEEDQRGKVLEESQKKEKISLKHFNIKGLLGQGSFGRVFLVQKKQTSAKHEQLYAMKEINRNLTYSKKLMESLFLQRKILANADSRFIVNLKYAFANKRSLFLVMEYASGGDASRISRGDLRQKIGQSQKQVIKFIMACVICGLQQLHKMDVVYRDMKPQNVLLFDNGYAKLSDFGLAKQVQRDQKCETIVGTALYNAPQIVLKTKYDKGVDIWGLGVLLYELITGQTPFRLQDVSSKIRFKRIVQQEQKNKKWRGHKLDPMVTDLICKMLQFENQKRIGYKDFQQIKQHLYFQNIKWEELEKKKLISPLQYYMQKNLITINRMESEKKSQDYSVTSQEQWDYK